MAHRSYAFQLKEAVAPNGDCSFYYNTATAYAVKNISINYLKEIKPFLATMRLHGIEL